MITESRKHSNSAASERKMMMPARGAFFPPLDMLARYG